MPQSRKFETRQYMLDNAFEAYYYMSDGVRRVGSHFHNYYEVYLFESGDISYTVGENSYDLLPGDILLIPPKEPHYPIFNDPDKSYSRLVLWISEVFIENTRESCNCDFSLPFNLIREHNMHLLRLEPDAREGLFAIARDMATRNQDIYTRAENNISLLSFLIKLNRLYTGYNYDIRKSDPFSRHLVKAVDYIVNNYDKAISLDDIARECYVSKYHLSREFKRTMGMSTYRYINLRRLYRAHQLIISGVKPGKVAKRCGFSDYSSFYRAFKKEFALSPSELAAKEW